MEPASRHPDATIAAGRSARRQRADRVIEGLLLIAAGLHGAHLRWLSDDAFITFRYAQNWVEGHGLVFNAGERVEGITNLLWAIVVGMLMRAGVRPELSTVVIGIAAYVAAVWLLIRLERRIVAMSGQDTGFAIPIAGLLAVADPDWATYATSGLETSLFTTVVLAGFTLITSSRQSLRTCMAAGCTFATSAWLRPEGAFVGALGAFALLSSPRHEGRFAVRARVSRLVAYGAALAIPIGLLTLFRVAYYGALVPNTYYAKSAYLSWWSQGLTYVTLYAERHVAVLALLAVGAAAFAKRLRSSGGVPRTVLSILATTSIVTVGYVAYVVKIGGDFMFARFLVPAAPFLLLAVAIMTRLGFAGRFPWAILLGVTAAVSSYLQPCPVGTDVFSQHGIVDERAFYRSGVAEQLDAHADRLRELTAGLPVRVAMYGAEARLVYRARFPTVVDAEGGLTDVYVARRPLFRRGRVGHEKLAPPEYLVLDRKVHFTAGVYSSSLTGLDRFIPLVLMDVGGFHIRLLHWDPVMVAELERRGGRVLGFPGTLDDVIGRLPTMSAVEIQRQLSRYDHFYFAHVADEKRRSAFVHALSARAQSRP